MPAHGAIRVLIDGAFTPTFDEIGALMLGGAWLAGLVVLATGVFRKTASARNV